MWKCEECDGILAKVGGFSGMYTSEIVWKCMKCGKQYICVSGEWVEGRPREA
jgi:uncharacterized protein with PIN domain